MENICGHVPPRVEKGEKRKEGGAKSRACNSMCGVGWGVEMRGCGQTWGLGEWCLLGSSLFPSLGRCAPTPPPSSGRAMAKKTQPRCRKFPTPPFHPLPSVVGTSSSPEAAPCPSLAAVDSPRFSQRRSTNLEFLGNRVSFCPSLLFFPRWIGSGRVTTPASPDDAHPPGRTDFTSPWLEPASSRPPTPSRLVASTRPPNRLLDSTNSQPPRCLPSNPCPPPLEDEPAPPSQPTS